MWCLQRFLVVVTIIGLQQCETAEENYEQYPPHSSRVRGTRDVPVSEALREPDLPVSLRSYRSPNVGNVISCFEMSTRDIILENKANLGLILKNLMKF